MIDQHNVMKSEQKDIDQKDFQIRIRKKYLWIKMTPKKFPDCLDKLLLTHICVRSPREQKGIRCFVTQCNKVCQYKEKRDRILKMSLFCRRKQWTEYTNYMYKYDKNNCDWNDFILENPAVNGGFY